MDMQPHEDPLIDEVRQRRKQVYLESGKDLEKLLVAILRIQAEHPGKVVNRQKIKAASDRP